MKSYLQRTYENNNIHRLTKYTLLVKTSIRNIICQSYILTVDTTGQKQEVNEILKIFP